jgi:hypothetical protein
MILNYITGTSPVNSAKSALRLSAASTAAPNPSAAIMSEIFLNRFMQYLNAVSSILANWHAIFLDYRRVGS